MQSYFSSFQYYDNAFSVGSMRATFSDASLFYAWLKTEIALAKAQEQAGVIPKGVAERLQQVASVEKFDSEAMQAEFEKIGFPILPFVKQLTKLCDAETARWVHYGATTQDILDTSTVLQIRDGLRLIEEDQEGIIHALATLARTHRNTVMAGRTFQQLAAPITFGYKAAVWLDEMLRHRQRLQEMKPRLLVGQCAGAVSTFATLGNKGPEVQRLIRSPYAIRPWQHVLEPLTGYLTLAENLLNEGPKFAQAWNFGPDDSDAQNVEWISKTMCSLWGESATYAIDSTPQPHEANYLKLDCSKAKAELGWFPEWDIETTLKSIVDWNKSFIAGDNISAVTENQIEQYFVKE